MTQATLRPALAALALLASALCCAPDAGASGMRAAYPWRVARPAPAVGDIVTTPLCEGFHLGNSLDANEVAPGRPLWLSRDPLGERGGLNLYGFVGNDPVNKWDYLGLSPRVRVDGRNIYLGEFLVGIVKGSEVTPVFKRGDLQADGYATFDHAVGKKAFLKFLKGYADWNGAVDDLDSLPGALGQMAVDDFLVWGRRNREGFRDDVVDRDNYWTRLKDLDRLSGASDLSAVRGEMADIGANIHWHLSREVGLSLAGSGFVASYIKLLRNGDNFYDTADEAFNAVRRYHRTGLTHHVRSLADIPTHKSGGFARWFDGLTPDDVADLYTNSKYKKKMATQLRGSGGRHEFLMVAHAPHWKKWGVTASEVQDEFSSSISYLNKFQAKGWKHSTGGKTLAHGSKTAHDALEEVIMKSNSLNEFKVNVADWADEWLEWGTGDLPSAFHR